MKRTISLVLGLAMVFGASISSNAVSPAILQDKTPATLSSTVTPRMSYEDKVRTIKAKSSWYSASYLCVPGDYFGGGVDDFVTLTGKIQFSATGGGSWKTLSTKSLNYDTMSIQADQKGYYRFVVTNNSSSSVTAECYVMIN